MEPKQEYVLTNESVDEISERVSEFLTTLNMESKNLLLIRLTIEELLLCWQEHFSPQTKCQVKIGYRFLRPFIQLEVEGPPHDPLNSGTDEYGSYRARLLSAVGLSPLFSYENGRNRILFKLKKAKANPLFSLALAVVLGLLAGSLGLFMPDMLRASMTDQFLTPIYDAFFHLMGTIAGPMVFLSVACGIYGIGDTTTFGRIGKRMVTHFIAATFLITILCVPLSMPFFSLNLTLSGSGGTQLSDLLQMMLGFIPTDIITPFQERNSMQIIFLGVTVGVSLLILGQQAGLVAQTIEQLNYVAQFLMECVSTLIPHFIFIVLLQMIWGGTLDVVLSAWKPFLVFLLLILFIAGAMILIVSIQCKVSPLLVLKKGLPTFIIGVTTASSVAAFGTCSSICDNKLGISKHLTSFGVPLGMVLFPPATSMYLLIICLHVADLYQTECSLLWFILAIFSATVLTVAAPPIPRGMLTCYTIMFTQLGLPTEALAIALAVDVLCDFVSTGMNMFCLQLDLVIQSAKMDLLDQTILHKEL